MKGNGGVYGLTESPAVHHETLKAFQKSFTSDVKKLVGTIQFGKNPFYDETTEFVII